MAQNKKIFGKNDKYDLVNTICSEKFPYVRKNDTSFPDVLIIKFFTFPPRQEFWGKILISD
jgi:hypothetical protein